MAGNLLDMGLRLRPQDALRGLRDWRFVLYTLIWGFGLCPLAAYVIAALMPLDHHYGIGLMLLGMAPCAPFLPMLVGRAQGDLGYTAALMALTAIGTVVYMPIVIPLAVQGLTISPLKIALPLIAVVVLPLAVGMSILQLSASAAERMQPLVKRGTGVATVFVVVLCLVIYGGKLLGLAGTFAIASQLLFFAVITIGPYLFAVGLARSQRVVLSLGMATRNVGAAAAPLLAVPDADQQAVVMVVLGLPMMIIASLLATRYFTRRMAVMPPV